MGICWPVPSVDPLILNSPASPYLHQLPSFFFSDHELCHLEPVFLSNRTLPLRLSDRCKRSPAASMRQDETEAGPCSCGCPAYRHRHVDHVAHLVAAGRLLFRAIRKIAIVSSDFMCATSKALRLSFAFASCFFPSICLIIKFHFISLQWHPLLPRPS